MYKQYPDGQEERMCFGSEWAKFGVLACKYRELSR